MARGPIVTPGFGATFLVEPSAFPEDDAGESFGPGRLGLLIADLELSVSGLSEPQRAMLAELWSAFTVPEPGPRAMPLAVYRAEARTFRDFDRAGWCYELDFDHGEDATRIAGLDLMARLSWSPAPTGALWTSEEAPEGFRGAFENVVRVLLAHAALRRRGAVLHSASVVDGGGARLFVGPSGAGKSTVGRLALASGREVGSDDLNPVVRRADGFHVAGSPFLGDVGSRCSGSHSLQGVYRLVKGEADALEPMGRAETVATLLACAPFVNRAPHLEERLWATLDAITGRVPGYVLTFRKEGTFWPLLDD